MCDHSIQKIVYYKKKDPPTNLLNYLAQRFPYLSKASWQEAINLHRIKINGQSVIGSYILNNLDQISYIRSVEEEPVVDKDFDIIWQDQHLLVVQKGGNLPVSISGRYYKNTLIEILRQSLNLNELYPVHRIDKETSGVVIFAKTTKAAGAVGKIFEAQDQQKIYHSLLDGIMPEDEIIVDQAIAKNAGRSKIHIRQIIDAKGKKAKSLFKSIVFSNKITFSEVITYSGRTHQIRCHAEYLNLPVLGDKLYGRSDEEFLKYLKTGEMITTKSGLQIKRQLLHATKIGFIHPFSNQYVSFFSNPTMYFEQELDLLYILGEDRVLKIKDRLKILKKNSYTVPTKVLPS